MSGLVDSDTGLAFGDSLVWQDAIGGAGLTVVTSTTGVVADIPFSQTQTIAALTVVNRLSAASLTIPTGSITQLQLVAQGTVAHVYVGPAASSGDPYDAASLTQVTFNGGSAGVSAATGVQTTSDVIAFTWDKTTDLLVCVDWALNDPTDYVNGAGPAWSTVYYKSGQDAGTLNKTGYSTLGANSAYCITKVLMNGF